MLKQFKTCFMLVSPGVMKCVWAMKKGSVWFHRSFFDSLIAKPTGTVWCDRIHASLAGPWCIACCFIIHGPAWGAANIPADVNYGKILA